MSSQDFSILTKIQESFEILDKLKNSNKEHNDLFNNILDIRLYHINQLKTNDLFTLNKSINVNDNSTQYENINNTNTNNIRVMSYYSEK